MSINSHTSDAASYAGRQRAHLTHKVTELFLFVFVPNPHMLVSSETKRLINIIPNVSEQKLSPFREACPYAGVLVLSANSKLGLGNVSGANEPVTFIPLRTLHRYRRILHIVSYAHD